MSDIQRIIISGDILRPGVTRTGRIAMTQRGNCAWLFGMLMRPLGDLLGIPVEIDTHFSTDKRRVLEDRYATLSNGSHPSVVWATIYNNENLLRQLFDIDFSYYDKSVVIGFELPPAVREILSSRNITWVSIEEHPLRFLSDTCFTISSSDTVALERLPPYSVSFDFFQVGAATLWAAGMRHARRSDTTRRVIFAAQTHYDKSLIVGGRIRRLEEFGDEVASFVSMFDEVLVKQHPLAILRAEEHAIFCKLGAKLLDGDLYAIMSSGRFDSLITLSSGAALEAQFFGIQSYSLLNRSSAIPEAYYWPLFTQRLWATFFNLGSRDSEVPHVPRHPQRRMAIGASLRSKRPTFKVSTMSPGV